MRVTLDNMRQVVPQLVQLEEDIDKYTTCIRELAEKTKALLETMGWEFEEDEHTLDILDNLTLAANALSHLVPAAEKWKREQEYFEKYGSKSQDWVAHYRGIIDRKLPEVEKYLRRALENLGYYPDK